jgi:hypothetical protein
VSDRALLAAAARIAIEEAEQTIDDLRSKDPVLSEIHTHELTTLRRVLNLLSLPAEDIDHRAIM